MSAILPYFMVGPPLYQDLISSNSSCKQIQTILRNELPIYPNVSLPTVDVRDVASAHIMAALSANFASRNDRFFLSARSLWFKDIIAALQQTNSNIKSRQIGYFQMKFGTFINRDLQSLIPFLDQEI